MPRKRKSSNTKKGLISQKRLSSFIDSNNWIFAKSYAKTHPHEYLIKDYLSPKDKKEFVWFVQVIRKYGIPERFFRNVYIYLYLNNYKYWTMDITHLL